MVLGLVSIIQPRIFILGNSPRMSNALLVYLSYILINSSQNFPLTLCLKPAALHVLEIEISVFPPIQNN